MMVRAHGSKVFIDDDRSEPLHIADVVPGPSLSYIRASRNDGVLHVVDAARRAHSLPAHSAKKLLLFSRIGSPVRARTRARTHARTHARDRKKNVRCDRPGRSTTLAAAPPWPQHRPGRSFAQGDCTRADPGVKSFRDSKWLERAGKERRRSKEVQPRRRRLHLFYIAQYIRRVWAALGTKYVLLRGSPWRAFPCPHGGGGGD